MRAFEAHTLVFLVLTLATVSSFAATDWRQQLDRFDWSRFDAASGNGLTAQPASGRHADEQPDLRGLRRDTAYFVGYQLVTIGILYVMPEGISGWSEEAKDEYSLDQWRDNVSKPHWDKDDHFINYVLHPYWGASYYVRARDRGLERGASILYAAALSTLYEFGVEALFEQPSIQDLIVTPLGAVLLGERFFRYQRKLRYRLAQQGLTTRERWALVLTDPLGALNERVDRWFGRHSQLALRAFTRLRPADIGALRPAAGPEGALQRSFGIRLELRF